MSSREKTRKIISSEARSVEQRSWLALWLRAAPMIGLGLGLIAWAAREPENAERLSLIARVAAVPVALLWLRAIVRAVALVIARKQDVVAATIGFVHPRVVLSSRFIAAVDVRARRAAEAHELMHVRHRDPLRILLARLATDLLWPMRGAQQRFRSWRHALELARDEEAIAVAGVRGADLAAAIISAARMHPSHTAAASAALLSDAELLQHRVAWLLTLRRAHIAPEVAASRRGVAAILGFLTLWIALGATAGEALVEPFLLR